MSYCRWSSDDFQCDLYCYEDVSGGYTTWVASNRVVGEVPKLAPRSMLETEEGRTQWQAAYRAQMDFLDTAERVPIGLPYDGERFNDPDLPSFLATLQMLREAGYRFPDYVFDQVWEEMLEEAKAGESREEVP